MTTPHSPFRLNTAAISDRSAHHSPLAVALLMVLMTPALAEVSPPPPAQDPVEMFAQRERDRTMEQWARRQEAWQPSPRFSQQSLQRQFWEAQRWGLEPLPPHPWGPHCPPPPYCRPPDYIPQPPFITCPPMWCP